jgi:ATP-binding cassette, subfamily B, bacterial
MFAQVTAARWAAVRCLWRCSRPLALGLLALALAAGVLPNLLIVAMGLLVVRAVGLVGHEAEHGTTAPLFGALAAVGVLYGLSLILAPVQEALDRICRVQLTHATQERLMIAVDAPVGTGHLEDRGVTARLDIARGTLSSFYPADAPGTLARVTGNRLSGLGAVVIVASFHWWLALALLGSWLAVRHRIRRIIVEDVRSTSGLANVLGRAEYLRGLAVNRSAARELRVFGASDWCLGTYQDAWSVGMGIRWAIRRRLYRTVAVAALAVLALYVVGFWLVAHSALGGSIGLESAVIDIVAIPATAAVGSVTFDDIGLEWMLSSLTEVDRLERDLAAPPPVAGEGADARDLPTTEIRFEQLSFTYQGATKETLHEIDLTVPVGRTTAIVGRNGSGKTTLVKLLARLHEPTGGRITVDRCDIRDLDPEAWRARIAVVFQEPARYPFTLRENVTLGAAPARSGDVAAAARDAGVLPVVDHLPNGWDTVLSASFAGVDLSGGQWQRIAIARALCAARTGASVLVLDEPTSAQDPDSEDECLNQLINATPGVTKLLVSHRLSGVRRADHIVVLEEGHIVEQGDHERLMAAEGRYAAMFRLQAVPYRDATAADGPAREGVLAEGAP